LLGAVEIYDLYVHGHSLDRKKFNYILVNFTILLTTLIASYVLLFTSPYETYQSYYLGGYFHISSGSLLKLLLSNIDNKIITIVLILSPLLFIPLRSKKWMFLLIPFIILCFFNVNNVYIYPDAFHFQYMVTVAPFVFLGLIETVNVGERDEPQQNKSMNKGVRHALITIRRKYLPRKEPIAVFIAILLFAVIFQPYSPLNTDSSAPFEMNIFHPNTYIYDEYKNVTD